MTTAPQYQRLRIAYTLDQATVNCHIIAATKSKQGYILIISPAGSSFEFIVLTPAG